MWWFILSFKSPLLWKGSGELVGGFNAAQHQKHFIHENVFNLSVLYAAALLLRDVPLTSLTAESLNISVCTQKPDWKYESLLVLQEVVWSFCCVVTLSHCWSEIMNQKRNLFCFFLLKKKQNECSGCFYLRFREVVIIFNFCRNSFRSPEGPKQKPFHILFLLGETNWK